MDDLENYRATLLHYTKLCASSWWRHQMENFSALLAFCAGNSPIPGEFPAQRPVTRNFDVFFDLRLNKRLSKLSWSWWSETPSSSLWPDRNDLTPLGEFKQDLQSRNAQFGSKSVFFVPCDLEIWWMTFKNNRAPLLYYIKLCASFKSHMWFQTGVTVRKRLIRIQIRQFFVPWDLEIWWMTLKNNRASLLCGLKLYASFHSHGWIQSKFTGRKCSIWVKIGDLLSRVTLFFMRMTLRNNRAPPLCCFKLYASFHSYRWIKTKVTLRKRSIRVKIGDFFVPCYLENWLMTLKNNRAPLLCYFKLCASSRNHCWIQSGVTVQKRPIWVKIDDFLSLVNLKFEWWPWKTIGLLS